MLARHLGQVILVSGAIPGERIQAKIDRIAHGVVYAHVESIDAASADRRHPRIDLSCAGTRYAHVAYPRQLSLKAEVLRDAFQRIARLDLPDSLRVTASPEEGYRMRAKLHYRSGRVGFFREGSHDLCDVRSTRQLLPASCDAVEQVAEALRMRAPAGAAAIDIAENVEASQRAIHLNTSMAVAARALSELGFIEGVTGLTIGSGARVSVLWGDPVVTDTLPMSAPVLLGRHAGAFFQGNRFLLTTLVETVLDHIDAGACVLDLYAGVGLFAVSAAVVRGASVTAVEGDRVAAHDLERNAERVPGRGVRAIHQAVEGFLRSFGSRPDVAILDPPRTGVSRVALQEVATLRAPRIVYVSCDVATLARDARRLIDLGYTLRHATAFDLFPNTPHVEAMIVFER